MMKMLKKHWILLGVLVLNLIANISVVNSQTETPIFRRGFWGNPVTLDPQNAWDSASCNIIDQVMESLVAYDLYDPNMTIVPQFATDVGTWNEDATEMTFNLRQDVTWHDGTPFNASCVKKSFDRLVHLIEIEESILGDLYEPLAQMYPTTPW